MSNSLSQLESMRRSFIANVSHELRTPMTTISGFVDGILDGTIPKEKHEQYLYIVSTETKRLSRLVQSMLSLARLESGEQKVNLTEFSLNDVICDVLVSQEQRINEKNIEIIGLDESEDINITADKDLIYQAIFNLVDNAIKFSNVYKPIKITVSRYNDKIIFKIRNEGNGINPNELQYIFDRFYKTDKSRSANKDGTGLGLYITKTILDIHNANISVSSTPNLFTEFTVEFI
jgi:signal transduction histidine kinase